MSHQFISERSQLERDRKEYKRDLQKVCAKELEASRREKKLASVTLRVPQITRNATELHFRRPYIKFRQHTLCKIA